MNTDVTPEYRFAHTMIRVRDLEKSLDFYTRLLGMHVLRQKEYPEGKFTNTFIGYGSEDNNTVIELTYNWDQEEPYEMGTGWGNIPRPAGPMKHGTRVIAFVEDPDGYKIELLEPLT